MILEQGVFQAGDVLKTKLVVDNQTSKTLNNTKILLNQLTSIFISNYKYIDNLVLIDKIDIGTINSNETKAYNYNLQLPRNIPESLSKTKDSKIGKIINIKYFLHFYAESFMSYNVEFDVPIYIIKRSEIKEQKKEGNFILTKILNIN